MHNIIEKYGFMNASISYLDKIVNNSHIEDNDENRRNLLICNKTFKLVCIEPAHLEEKFLEVILGIIETPLGRKQSKNRTRKNMTSYNNNSMGFGNIMPLMSADALEEYTSYSKAKLKKSLLYKIIEKSLKNIFDGMNKILDKLPYKDLSLGEFKDLANEDTVYAEILLIFKSMINDVISVTILVVKIKMLTEMLSEENNDQFSLDSTLFDDYKKFTYHTKVKWNDMCRVYELPEFYIDINGKNTGDFEIKSSMYGYYLLDASKDIQDSFIDGNDIITDKELLLDMKLWLKTIKRELNVLFINDSGLLGTYKYLSDNQKKNYIQVFDYIKKLPILYKHLPQTGQEDIEYLIE